MLVVVFQNSMGGNSVIYPTGEIPIHEVALKDVPPGVSFKIIDSADIDTVDLSTPDGQGAEYGNGSNNNVVAWLPGHVPVVQMFDSDPDAEPVFLLRGVDALPASFVLA